MRNSAFGLQPAANHATSSSRVSIGVRSTWSRAMGVPAQRAADHTRGVRGRAMRGGRGLMSPSAQARDGGAMHNDSSRLGRDLHATQHGHGRSRLLGLAKSSTQAPGYSSLGVTSSTAPGSVRESTNAMESMKRPGSGEAKSPLAGSTVASSAKSLPLVK